MSAAAPGGARRHEFGIVGASVIGAVGTITRRALASALCYAQERAR